MKRFALSLLLLVAGCAQQQPQPMGSSANMVATPEPQSALNPQSNASPKNNLPPETDAASGTCPIGATAACKDGSYTDTKNRKIACVQHGGVLRWCP
jgi:hypothetical protein